MQPILYQPVLIHPFDVVVGLLIWVLLFLYITIPTSTKLNQAEKTIFIGGIVVFLLLFLFSVAALYFPMRIPV